jgi:DNA repair photolyase
MDYFAIKKKVVDYAQVDRTTIRHYTIQVYSTRKQAETKIELVQADRAIERSRKECIKDFGIVNPARGCSFGCLFCGLRRNSPEENAIRVRANLPQLLERELSVRRRRSENTGSFLFNTTTDSFQPIESLLNLTHEAMQIILEAGGEIHFLTRGLVPESFGDLFTSHPGKVHAQVSMLTMDENLSAMYEPFAASPQERLESIRRLAGWGVEVRGRIEPLIPFLSDTVGHLEELVRYLRSVGVNRCSTTYLVLRPHLLDLFEEVLPATHFHLIKGSFKGQAWRKVGIHQMTKLLPERTRSKGYQRLFNIARRLEMEIGICACQNPVLGSSCFSPAADDSRKEDSGKQQLDLFG